MKETCLISLLLAMLCGHPASTEAATNAVSNAGATNGQRIFFVPGTGNVAFPGYMSDGEVRAAVERLSGSAAAAGTTTTSTNPAGKTATGFSANSSAGSTNALIEEIRVKAEKGDASSQFLMGTTYRLGVGVAVDHREAAKWYQMAADRGFTNALAQLAEIYGDEESPLYNANKSFQLAKLAADAGDASAQVSIGFKYVEGQGVTADAERGLQWLRQGISALEAEPRPRRTLTKLFLRRPLKVR